MSFNFEFLSPVDLKVSFKTNSGDDSIVLHLRQPSQFTILNAFSQLGTYKYARQARFLLKKYRHLSLLKSVRLFIKEEQAGLLIPEIPWLRFFKNFHGRDSNKFLLNAGLPWNRSLLRVPVEEGYESRVQEFHPDRYPSDHWCPYIFFDDLSKRNDAIAQREELRILWGLEEFPELGIDDPRPVRPYKLYKKKWFRKEGLTPSIYIAKPYGTSGVSFTPVFHTPSTPYKYHMDGCSYGCVKHAGTRKDPHLPEEVVYHEISGRELLPDGEYRANITATVRKRIPLGVVMRHNSEGDLFCFDFARRECGYQILRDTLEIRRRVLFSDINYENSLEAFPLESTNPFTFPQELFIFSRTVTPKLLERIKTLFPSLRCLQIQCALYGDPKAHLLLPKIFGNVWHPYIPDEGELEGVDLSPEHFGILED